MRVLNGNSSLTNVCVVTFVLTYKPVCMNITPNLRNLKIVGENIAERNSNPSVIIIQQFQYVNSCFSLHYIPANAATWVLYTMKINSTLLPRSIMRISDLDHAYLLQIISLAYYQNWVVEIVIFSKRTIMILHYTLAILFGIFL